MATVTVFNAARMQEIEDNAIVGAELVDGELILEKHDGTLVNLGNVSAIPPLDFMGNWDDSTTYGLGKIVIHSGDAWVCVIPVTAGNEGLEPGIDPNWETFSLSTGFDAIEATLAAIQSQVDTNETALDTAISDLDVVEAQISTPTRVPLTVGDTFYVRRGSEMSEVTFDDLASLLQPSPFPVSLMEGVGPVGVQRVGNDYYLLQDHSGEWIRWKLEQNTIGLYTQRTLAACDIVLASVPVDGTGITRAGGTWSGSYLTTATGAYLEFTGSGKHVGFKFGFASNGGIHLVEIDGDATLANMLPTAQEWVDASRLASTALVANGGTLNPTDRIIDQYHSAGAAYYFTMIARNLTNESHTVRITNTGYKRAASSDDRLFYNNAESELIYWSDGTEDITDSGTNLDLVRWLQEPGSSAEYALTLTPSGGTPVMFLGGKAHGYEEEISFNVYVENALTALSDGDILVADSIRVVKASKIHHPYLSSPDYVCDAITTYTLTERGLDCDTYIEFQTAGTASSCYLGMATWEHMRRDGTAATGWPTWDAYEYFKWTNGPSFSVGAQDGSAHDAPNKKSASVLWQKNAPEFASSWAVGHWVRQAGPISKLWVQDRNASALDKVYPEIETGSPYSGAFDVGDTWAVAVRYCAMPTSDPDTLFDS